jgi:hypothetical protein
MAGPTSKIHLGNQGKAGSADGGVIAASCITGTHLESAAIIAAHHLSASIIAGTHLQSAAVIAAHHLSANIIAATHLAATTIVTGSTHIVANSIPNSCLVTTPFSSSNVVMGETATFIVNTSTSFTFSNTPAVATNVGVAYNGQAIRYNTDYTVTADVCHLTFTPSSGDYCVSHYTK